MQSLQQLNQQFAIDDQLQFEYNAAGMIVATITNTFATLSLSMYGAQVLSYRPVTESEDVLFLSDKAAYGEGRAIRGGVPICWPWFSDDAADLGVAPHGFARNQQWQVVATKTNQEGSTEIRLALSQTKDSLSVWPYEFNLILDVIVGESLDMTLVTENVGQKTFTITQALHTYFKVSDVQDIEITGLDDKQYLDKVIDFSEQTQHGVTTISGEVDRVYLAPPSTVTLTDAGFKREIIITSTGNKTLVVWNPGVEIIQRLSDLSAEAYKDFVCIETANAMIDKVTLAAGQRHSLSANYQVNKQ
tara:strand:- start:31 stop:939 length:909 start_codon:yes stop_codon:yes gene_type:complete